MKRTIGFLTLTAMLLIAYPGAASAQDTGKTIDFSCRAMTVKALMEKLAQETGIPFACSALMASDVLLIEAKSVTVSALMDKIALAATGEWRKDGAGFSLNRDLTRAKQEDREYLEHRASRIKLDIDKGLQDVAKQGTFDPNKTLDPNTPGRGSISTNDGGQQISFRIPNGEEAPIGRALNRALAGFNALDLAAIPQGTRTVYSTNPTPMQRQMPGAATKAIQTFIQEQQAYVRAAGQSAQPQMNVFFLGGETRPLAFEGGVSKAIIVLYRGFWQDSIEVELRIADQTGQIKASYSKVLGPGYEPPGRNAAPSTEPAAVGEPIEISDTAKRLAALLGTSGGRAISDTFSFVSRGAGGAAFQVVGSPSGGAREPEKVVAPDLRPLLDNPDKNEPLSFAISELCASLKPTEGNLVALLPDSLLIPLSSRCQQPLATGELRRILETQLDMKLASKDGWAVLTPKYPSLSRFTRVDRPAFANLLNSIQKEGRASLHALAAYAANHLQPSMTGIEMNWVKLLTPQAEPAFRNATTAWSMLKFYAVLDPVQKTNLERSGMIPIGNLSMPQMTALKNMVYNDPSGPTRQVMQPPMPPVPPGPGGRGGQQNVEIAVTRSVIAMAPQGGGGRALPGIREFSTNLSDERTEFLPNGVPTIGQLRLSIQSTDGVYATESETAVSGRFLGPEEYGMMQGLASGPAAGFITQYSFFRNARVVRMNFTFQLTPEASLTRSLDDNVVDMVSRPMTFAQLPQGFRDAAEAARRRMAEAETRGRMQFGGGNPPPPER